MSDRSTSMLSRRPVANADVVSGSIAGRRVLFDLVGRRLHWLNDTAAIVWDELGRGRPVKVISSDLAGRFDEPTEIVRLHVDRLVDHLVAAGLLVTRRDEAVGPPGPGSTRIRPDAAARGWPHDGCYRALDARIRIETDDDELGGVIAAALDPLWSSEAARIAVRVAEGRAGTCRVTTDDTDGVLVSSRLAAVDRVLGEVNAAAVESTDDLVLHAGAVEADGRVVVLPGRSNRGKSTLTAALVKEGLGYLSDEAVAIARGRVGRPFAKSIRLDPGSFAVHPDLRPALRPGLGGSVDAHVWNIEPCRIGSVSSGGEVVGVVCPEFRPGSDTVVTTSEPGRALSVLVGEAFDFTVGGQAVFDIVCELAERVPFRHVRYGNLADVVSLVGRMLAVD